MQFASGTFRTTPNVGRFSRLDGWHSSRQAHQNILDMNTIINLYLSVYLSIDSCSRFGRSCSMFVEFIREFRTNRRGKRNGRGTRVVQVEWNVVKIGRRKYNIDTECISHCSWVVTQTKKYVHLLICFVPFHSRVNNETRKKRTGDLFQFVKIERLTVNGPHTHTQISERTGPFAFGNN